MLVQWIKQREQNIDVEQNGTCIAFILCRIDVAHGDCLAMAKQSTSNIVTQRVDDGESGLGRTRLHRHGRQASPIRANSFWG